MDHILLLAYLLGQLGHVCLLCAGLLLRGPTADIVLAVIDHHLEILRAATIHALTIDRVTIADCLCELVGSWPVNLDLGTVSAHRWLAKGTTPGLLLILRTHLESTQGHTTPRLSSLMQLWQTHHLPSHRILVGISVVCGVDKLDFGV